MNNPDALRYIVRRFNWRRLLASDEGTWYTRFSGAVTVAEFDDPNDADTDRWRREMAVRAEVNPFRCGLELPDFTHFPDYALKDYLLDDGVKPAKSDSTARVRWDVWWERQSPTWSDDRKARVWEALDKVRFFEVVRWPAGESLHVVVEGVTDTPSSSWWAIERARTQGFRQRYGYEGGPTGAGVSPTG